MSENIEYRGICSICDRASDCNYLQGNAQPVIECEEFVCSTRQPARLTREDILSQEKSRHEKETPSKYKGLCANCDNSKTCTYPKLEGGIWHCEEYH